MSFAEVQEFPGYIPRRGSLARLLVCAVQPYKIAPNRFLKWLHLPSLPTTSRKSPLCQHPDQLGALLLSPPLYLEGFRTCRIKMVHLLIAWDSGADGEVGWKTDIVGSRRRCRHHLHPERWTTGTPSISDGQCWPELALWASLGQCPGTLLEAFTIARFWPSVLRKLLMATSF